MTGDTTPQQQAVELASNFLNERFGITMWNRDLDHHSKELVQILADAGLLCSSPVVQPEDEEGSLRSEPSAAGEAEAVVFVTAYQVSCLPLDHQAAQHLSVWVKSRGSDRWAVLNGIGFCLGTDYEWEYEPMSSSRTDEWLDAHRFDLETALRLAKEVAPNATVNGLTVADVLGGKFRG